MFNSAYTVQLCAPCPLSFSYISDVSVILYMIDHGIFMLPLHCKFLELLSMEVLMVLRFAFEIVSE